MFARSLEGCEILIELRLIVGNWYARTLYVCMYAYGSALIS